MHVRRGGCACVVGCMTDQFTHAQSTSTCVNYIVHMQELLKHYCCVLWYMMSLL